MSLFGNDRYMVVWKNQRVASYLLHCHSGLFNCVVNTTTLLV